MKKGKLKKRRVNKSELMKHAWKLFKEYNGYIYHHYEEGVGYVREIYNITFGECLSQTWEYFTNKVNEENKMIEEYNSFLDRVAL